MKKYALNDITQMQYIFMIHGSQIGIGILSLPAELAKKAGTDGWISLLIGWALASLSSVMIILAMKKHPDDTIYDLIPRYFGKAIGTAINIAVILYYSFAYFVCFIASIMILKLELLAKTPPFMIVLLFAIPTYIIVRNHVRVLGRYAELTFWGFLWIIFVYMTPLNVAHWLNLLPVLKEGWGPVLSAVKTTGLSFLGFETAFILYPFLKHKEKAVQGVVIGNAITLAAYLIGILVCFLFFSPDDITSYEFPELKVVKIIEFRFLERFEIIFLVAYTFMLSRVWMFYLYCAVFGTGHLLGKKDHRPYLIIVLILVFLLSFFYSPSNDQIKQLLKLLSNMGLYFAYALPLFLLAYTRIVGRIRKGEEA